MAKRVIAKRRVSKIYRSPGALAMARGPRAVTQSPKCPIPPEESDDKEESTQNSGVDREEDDNAGDAKGDDDSEEDEESEDRRGVGAAEASTGGGNADQGGVDDGGRSGGNEPPNNPPNNPPNSPPNNPPNNNNNGGGGGGPTTNAGGTLQPGYLPDGTRYSIPFYNILISIGLTTANVRRLFQEDIRSANDFATYIGHEALERMLEKDDYGLNNLSMVKQQKLRAFHKWLCKQKAQEFDLSDVDVLSSFDANAMATILAEERQSGGMIREHGGLNRGTKDLGMTLPLFKGNQKDWKSWNKKFRTFLNQQRQDDGKPYIYVIVDLAKENQSVQDLCKGTKLSGKNYEEDNFKVSQWLQMALADGSALIFAENHDGDGRSGYKELLVIYQNDENKINRLQELWNKLKVIQFRGVKNYPWTKFGNTLETIYKEMETIRKLVDKEVQVQHLMEAVVYPPYKHILADVLFACPEAKKNLSQAMGLVTTKATYYGTVLGDVSKLMAGTAVGASATSDTRSIRKLKQQVKILKKKAPSASKQEGGKAGGKDDKNYIPPAVMDAV